MYDISSKMSFERAIKWMEEVESKASANVCLILVGNKRDLANSRQVSIEQGSDLALSKGMEFLECSAKTGYNINEIFLKPLSKGGITQHTKGILLVSSDSSKTYKCCLRK